MVFVCLVTGRVLNIKLYLINVDGKELANDSFTSEIGKNGVAGYDVLFSSPVTVEKDRTVTISATISGPMSCYGENGKINVEGLTVSFHDVKGKDTNGTDRLRGQFCEIITSDS